MTENKSSSQQNREDDTVRVLPPDFSLKKKIGMNVNLNEIFTPERIAQAQKTIDDTQAEFVSWAQKDLIELDHAYRAIARNPEEAPQERIDKVRKLAFSLKCQSGTFGFDLGSNVAKSLYSYTVRHEKYDRDNIAVLRKHIDSLEVIFQQNIQGDGGDIGKELSDKLEKLIAKFEPSA